MKNTMKKTLAVLLCAAAITTSAFAQEVVDTDSEYDVMPLAAEDNEIPQDYDVTLAYSDDYTWAQRIYEVGGWFTNAAANTEIQGDYSYAVADYTTYVYVYMENTNDGTEDEDVSEEMDKYRVSQACAGISGSDYATKVIHEATASLQGELCFEATFVATASNY